jgi:hypothetical protein
VHPTIGRFASRTLAGDDLALPDDLDGPALLLFAYRQDQQSDVETWLPAVPPDGSVRVLEVPVLGRRWLPGRRFIDGGMASNMDETTRRQTMCVYTDVAGFRRDVLGVDTTEILAALVTDAGAVRWHATGPATRETTAALRSAIAATAGDD